MAAAPGAGGDTVSELEQYQFDRLGYTHLPGCLSARELAEINAAVDAMQPPGPLGSWHGEVEVHSYYGGRGGRHFTGTGADAAPDDGHNLQHIAEAGPAFELLDHRAWLPRVATYLGRAPPFVNEFFANVRGPGGFIGLHSGGWYAKQHDLSQQHRGVGHILPRPGELGRRRRQQRREGVGRAAYHGDGGAQGHRDGGRGDCRCPHVA